MSLAGHNRSLLLRDWIAIAIGIGALFLSFYLLVAAKNQQCQKVSIADSQLTINELSKANLLK